MSRLYQRNSNGGTRPLGRVLAVLIWLAVWEFASRQVGQEILLVSPVKAISTLARLMGTSAFYEAVLSSFGRILLGFAMAACSGALLASLAFVSPPVAYLIDAPIATIKATPVASVVILALVWIKAANLSVFTSFLMVLPTIYFSVLTGLRAADPKLLEMASVYRMRPARCARAIYAPAAYPYFLSGCLSAMGMCWKAGIAAEVIGQPSGSIGDNLYRAKIFLATDELFAWTIAIILLSVLFEKLMFLLITRLKAAAFGGVTK